MNLSEKQCDKKYKDGLNDLKTGLFSFKFTKDYFSASSNFTEAAKGYRKLKKINKAIDAFKKAIECNKNQKDFLETACDYAEIGEMQIFDLELIDEGVNSLKEASYNFYVAGRAQNAVKVYTDNANKLMLEKNYKKAEILLKLAYSDCMEHCDDEITAISLEDVANNLVEIYCSMNNFKEAIKILTDYIELQKKTPKCSKYKLSKNMMREAILRIIIGEAYMVDKIIEEMLQHSYEDTNEDIGDLRKLVNSLQKLNKKDFNFCCNCAFNLFQSSLLKALRDLYNQKEKDQGTQEDDNKQPVLLLPLNNDEEKKKDNGDDEYL